MSKQVVTLNLFYGVATYDAAGKVTSRNEPVKIIHKSTEWENFLKHLNITGISKVVVTKVVNLNDNKEVKDLSKFQEEVDEYFKINEVPLTPEQKQIQDLQKQIDALTKKNESKAAAKDVVNELKADNEDAKQATEK